MKREFLIYKIDPDSGKTYVTGIGDSVGYFSGPNDQESACDFGSQENAEKALAWLNDPETWFAPPETHFIEIKP